MVLIHNMMYSHKYYSPFLIPDFWAILDPDPRSRFVLLCREYWLRHLKTHSRRVNACAVSKLLPPSFCSEGRGNRRQRNQKIPEDSTTNNKQDALEYVVQRNNDKQRAVMSGFGLLAQCYALMESALTCFMSYN